MKLKEARKSKKMTQQEVADMLNIERNSYARYEMGTREPDMNTLTKLSQIFGVSISYLLGERDDETRTEKESIPAQEARQEAFDKYGILFSAAEGCTPEEINAAVAMLNAFKARGER